MRHNFYKHFRFIIILELLILAIIFSSVANFWQSFCGGEIAACLKDSQIGVWSFLNLSIVRPFLFTPLNLFAAFGGHKFGVFWGTLLTAFGAVLSCGVLYGISLFLGNRFIRPWLSSNLPMTYKFLHSQGWKIVLATRFIPLFPYDLLSLFYGLVNFHWRYVLGLSFLASLPEIYIFADIASPDSTFAGSLARTLTIVSLFFLSPGIFLEYRSRKSGSGMWIRLKEMWKELLFEIRLSNIVIREKKHDSEKIPVFLVYGFFASRKTLTVLGHLLERRGFEVITFNLGGMFGVFSTKGIPETAIAIERKLSRYVEKHGIEKLHIIAHSKGGLVAFWWLLRLGGSKYCKKLITLGTPFDGTYWTWLSFLTPLGVFMPDMWQMRPGSGFLETLKNLKIPEDVFIYNIYSDQDSIATGERGVLKSKHYKQIKPIAMHHVHHDDFLKRRDVCDTLAYILESSSSKDKN